jgi:hypothetical protein
LGLCGLFEGELYLYLYFTNKSVGCCRIGRTEKHICYETLAVSLSLGSTKNAVAYVVVRGVPVVLKLGDELLAITDRTSANLFCEEANIQKFAFLRNNKQ